MSDTEPTTETKPETKAETRARVALESRLADVAAARDSFEQDLRQQTALLEELRKDLAEAKAFAAQANEEALRLRRRLRAASKADIELPEGCWLVVESFAASPAGGGRQVGLTRGDVLAESEAAAKEAASLNRRVVQIAREDFDFARKNDLIQQ